MSNEKLFNESENHSLRKGDVIERMDLDCDETLDYLKETRADYYDLKNEREEEIFMYGFVEAMEYFRDMLESVL